MSQSEFLGGCDLVGRAGSDTMLLIVLPSCRIALLPSSGRLLPLSQCTCVRAQGLENLRAGGTQTTWKSVVLPFLTPSPHHWHGYFSQGRKITINLFSALPFCVWHCSPWVLPIWAFSIFRRRRRKNVLFGIMQQHLCLQNVSPIGRFQFKIQISSDKTDPGWLFPLMVSISGLFIVNDCNTTGFWQNRGRSFEFLPTIFSSRG